MGLMKIIYMVTSKGSWKMALKVKFILMQKFWKPMYVRGVQKVHGNCIS